MTAAIRAAPKNAEAAEPDVDPFAHDLTSQREEDQSSQQTHPDIRPFPRWKASQRRLFWPVLRTLFWPEIKFWGWAITTKTIVTVVYEALISQGLRYVLPDIGMRLYKLPGLAFLERYTATYRLDLAHVFALVPLLSAWILWHLNLEMYLRPEVFAERFRRWDLDRVKRVVVTMGAIIIAGDAGLFCAAVTLVRWGEAKLSPAAVLATAVYVTVLGFVTWVSIWLKDGVDEAKKKINHLKKEDEEI